MTVIGEQHVEEEVARGRRVIVVERGDVLTPQARDLIQQLGLSVVDERPAPASPPRVDPAIAAQRLLLKRSPRWVSPDPPRGADPVTLSRVAIVGAGNVGATTGHLVSLHSMSHELVLIDLVPGLAESVALDIMHASGITGSTTHVAGGTGMDLVAGADVVVITAGRPRSPGMDRAALIEINGRVVRSVAETVSEHAPDAVIIVVTNPLDEMTGQAARASGFLRERVLGMAGTLDSSRFRAILAREAKVTPRDVEAFTLGSHGSEMVPIVSLARIKGRPLDHILSEETIDACVAETVGAGGQVVALRKTGSAYVAPAHAIAEVLEALRGARVGAIPVSVELDGEYGIEGVVVGVPARLGLNGVSEVVEMPISDGELRALQLASAKVGERLEVDG